VPRQETEGVRVHHKVREEERDLNHGGEQGQGR